MGSELVYFSLMYQGTLRGTDTIARSSPIESRKSYGDKTVKCSYNGSCKVSAR